MARSHQIEYLRPVFQDDELVMRTWIAGMERVKSVRHYEFVKEGVVIAQGGNGLDLRRCAEWPAQANSRGDEGHGGGIEIIGLKGGSVAVRCSAVQIVYIAFRLVLVLGLLERMAAETLPPLDGKEPPQTVAELWSSYDPDAEPLEVKVIKEYQEDGLTIRMLTYTIGTFKGVKSKMAAWYAFPTKHEGKLPALIQMHGGGQRAEIHSVKYGAQNGYACLAINWGGRLLERAGEDDSGTDWGAVDATQTGHNGHYGSLLPDDRTIDPVESPRNNNWFLIVIGAKRGVSFLCRQPEVDAKRIGAFGHSMGGKLTVMLSGADPRIKVAAPSCGGCGSAPDSIRKRPQCRGASPRRVRSITRRSMTRPISSASRLRSSTWGRRTTSTEFLITSMRIGSRLPSKVVNYTVTPHMNHRATAEHVYPGMLFFADHLKRDFRVSGHPWA